MKYKFKAGDWLYIDYDDNPTDIKCKIFKIINVYSYAYNIKYLNGSTDFCTLYFIEHGFPYYSKPARLLTQEEKILYL